MTDQPDPTQHPLAGNEEYEALVTLGRRNQRRIHEVAQQGIQLNDDSIMRQRLELFIEFVLPSDSLERVQFETMFGKQIEETLDRAEREINQAKLLGRRPGQAGPSLIVPGR